MDKKKSFFKKEEKPNFHSMLLNQCEEAEDAVSLLMEFMDAPDDRALADQIRGTEHLGDEKQRKLIAYLEESFITPVSRHYLFNLSRVIDDVTDKINDIKDFILYFDYRAGDTDREMIGLCRDSIYRIYDAVQVWDEDEEDFWRSVRIAKKNENLVRRLYWENIKKITEEDDLRNIIVTREFSRDLDSLADKIGKAADRLSDLKIKSIK